MFKMSQSALACVLPSEVSSPAPSQGPGLSVSLDRLHFCTACRCLQVHIGVDNLMHELLSHSSARMVSCVFLVTG